MKHIVRVSDFEYELHPEFIAQVPIEPRDASKLLVLDRESGSLSHRMFSDLPQYMNPGDLLVLNNTLVVPARLHGRKVTGGRIELLLLKRISRQTWEVIVRGSGLHVDTRILVDSESVDLTAAVVQKLEGPRRVVRFSQPVTPLLHKVGVVPLPPYIRTPLSDAKRYQTIFASIPGSAAAPTAGMHFT